MKLPLRASWPLAVSAALLLAAWTARAQERTPTPVVAVFEIENRGSPLSAEELLSLTDYLGTKLGEGGRFQIIPRQEIRRRLVEQKRESYKDCYDQFCQIEIGREMAAEFTASASISRVGSTCLVTAAMYDLRKAATADTASARGPCTPDDLLGALEEIAVKLQGRPEARPITPTGEPASGGVEDARAMPALAETPPLARPLRQERTKNTLLACLLASFPGGGMFYLEKWGWGLVYSLGTLGGLVSGPVILAEEKTVIGILLLLGGTLLYSGSFIHTLIAAGNWRDPDVERIAPVRSFLPVTAGEPTQDPQRALFLPVFSGRF